MQASAVDSNVLRLPNPFMLVNTIALQEAKASTAIENVFTTEDERINAATKEVLRYREALWEGHAQLEKKRTITQNLITKIFQQIKNTNAGFRSPHAQIVIRQGQSEFRTGEIVYTRPEETVAEYYFNLGAVTQRSSWKSWVLFMLEAMEKTSVLTNRLINETVSQMEATLDYGKKHIKWYSKEVNEALFAQPYSRAKTIGTIVGKRSRTTITKYMDELVQTKIVTPKKVGSAVYYLNDNLIRILEG